MFVIALRGGGDLAAMVANSGWQPTVVRMLDQAERGFLTSGAPIAIVDGRGAFDGALAGVRALAGAVEANGAALLVILARRELARIDLLFDAGATHYLVSPFEPGEFATAMLFAARHADRCGATRIASPDIADEPGSPSRGQTGQRDPLTGVGDARAAGRWVASQLLRAAAPPRCALAMVAIERFDMINAAFGRAAGDIVLEAVARRIERVLQGLDGRRKLIARMSGADFLIGIGGERSLDEVQFVADRVREALDRPFVSGDRVIELSCRIGIAADEGAGEPAALLRRASGALARAKEGPSGAVRLLHASDEEELSRESQLEVDLRHALDADEIDIMFQPQVTVAGGAIIGAEALARWRHPRLGPIGAEALLAAAERSDFMDALSRHIHRKALAEAAAWPPALDHLRVSINVTAGDLGRADFAERFAGKVDSQGIAHSRITVEIVESDLIGDLSGAAELLADLRARGFRVAIDDFGTGYSSLAYLKALPLDYLKIDRRLSQDISGSGRDRVVVHGVIEMARSLGLTVIAEGVETEEQLALLAAEGCQLYQGFLCAPALTSAELAAFVSRNVAPA